MTPRRAGSRWITLFIAVLVTACGLGSSEFVREIDRSDFQRIGFIAEAQVDLNNLGPEESAFEAGGMYESAIALCEAAVASNSSPEAVAAAVDYQASGAIAAGRELTGDEAATLRRVMLEVIAPNAEKYLCPGYYRVG